MYRSADVDYFEYDRSGWFSKLMTALWICLCSFGGWFRAKVSGRRIGIRDRGLAVRDGEVFSHNSLKVVGHFRWNQFCPTLLRLGRSSSGEIVLWCPRCEYNVQDLGGSPSSIEEWLKSEHLGK